MQFFIRWLVNGLGIWIAAALLGSDRLSVGNRFSTIVFAGLVLALINIFIRPLIVILSLPAIIFSLGLFMIVINGFVIVIASKLYTPLHVKNLFVAMVAGMVIGLVNYLISRILEEK